MSVWTGLRFNVRMECAISVTPEHAGPSRGSSQTLGRTSPEAMQDAPDVNPLIHIVDDDDAVRSALRMLVMSFGWKARAFGSGQAFLDALPQAKPDCILLDLDMPGMNGAEVQESLQAQGIDIPVIIITGQKNSLLASRALAAGACGMLGKPFQDEELKLLIERSIHPQH